MCREMHSFSEYAEKCLVNIQCICFQGKLIMRYLQIIQYDDVFYRMTYQKYKFKPIWPYVYKHLQNTIDCC